LKIHFPYQAVELNKTKMTTQLKWRLSKLPTVDELATLLEKKIITQEEVKEILFNKETTEDRDIESYKQEIKFLRELIDNLSKSNRNTLLTEIRYVEKPVYKDYDWYRPYTVLCNAVSSGFNGSVTAALDTSSISTTFYS
jgi:ribosomal protein L16 Arg81 hydroxylase